MPFNTRAPDTIANAALEHPWRDRLHFATDSADTVSLSFLPVDAGFVFNSELPYGINDGAVWAGRGLTLIGNAGVSVSRGPFSLVFAPVAFWAQNAEFPLLSTGPAFRNAVHPNSIDLPQRFGDEAYARFDFGQSTIRAEAMGVQLGVSTATQVWGPAVHLPLVLGGNAPGFAHAFLGTSDPLTSRLGSLHARFLWGSLRASDFSPEETNPRRLMAGWVAGFTPSPFPGLEVGATRFLHLPWPGEGEVTSSLLRPFEAFLKAGVSTDAAESNQLVSVFGRWSSPESGFEVYGEFAREDHSYNFRDFILLPDHTGAFVVGLAKVWRSEESTWWQFRSEFLNSGRSQLVQIRYFGPFYLHHALRQGHTHRGQILGSPAALGGGGATIVLDRYDPEGRWTFGVSRQLQDGDVSTVRESDEYPQPIDVLYQADLERVFFQGPLSYTIRVGSVYNFDRHRETDAVNFNVSFGASFDPAIKR